MNTPDLVGQLREAELESDGYGEPTLLGVIRSLLSQPKTEIQVMLQVIGGPDQEGVSLDRLQR